MNLINILYEPYVIIIFIALIITLITYFIIRKGPSDPKDPSDSKDPNITKTLLYTFLISFVVLMICKYAFSFMNKNNFFQKGGDAILDINNSDRLSVVADDVDIGILDN